MGPLLRHLCLSAAVLTVLLPIGWVVLLSVTPAAAHRRWIPRLDSFDSSAYGAMLRQSSALSRNLLNSAVVAIGTVLATAVCAVLGGYALAHLRVPSKVALAGLLVAIE